VLESAKPDDSTLGDAPARPPAEMPRSQTRATEARAFAVIKIDRGRRRAARHHRSHGRQAPMMRSAIASCATVTSVETQYSVIKRSSSRCPLHDSLSNLLHGTNSKQVTLSPSPPSRNGRRVRIDRLGRSRPPPSRSTGGRRALARRSNAFRPRNARSECRPRSRRIPGRALAFQKSSTASCG